VGSADVPKELGCGSGMTWWRRLRDWQQEGIWDLIHFALRANSDDRISPRE
jgi:hypothetical protein